MSIVPTSPLNAIAMLLLGLVPCTQATVPITIAESGHETVPVFVEGIGRRQFVLDTGAEGSAVYEGFSKEAGLKPSANSETLAGQTGAVSVSAVRLPSFALDGFTIEAGLTAVVIQPRADGVLLNGIIGLDVFGQKLLDFNLPAKSVALHPGATVLAEMRAMEAINASPTTGGLLTVPVRLGGIDAVAVIDTGARKTRINWKLGEKLGLSPDDIADGDVVLGATNNPLRAGSATVHTVEFGKRVLTEMPIQVIDLPVFELFGVAALPAVILGLDWLMKTRMIVDFPQRHVWFIAVDH